MHDFKIQTMAREFRSRAVQAFRCSITDASRWEICFACFICVCVCVLDIDDSGQPTTIDREKMTLATHLFFVNSFIDVTFLWWHIIPSWRSRIDSKWIWIDSIRSNSFFPLVNSTSVSFYLVFVLTLNGTFQKYELDWGYFSAEMKVKIMQAIFQCSYILYKQKYQTY